MFAHLWGRSLLLAQTLPQLQVSLPMIPLTSPLLSPPLSFCCVTPVLQSHTHTHHFIHLHTHTHTISRSAELKPSHDSPHLTSPLTPSLFLLRDSCAAITHTHTPFHTPTHTHTHHF